MHEDDYIDTVRKCFEKFEYYFEIVKELKDKESLYAIINSTNYVKLTKFAGSVITKTAWISPEDGLLVRDINNNGKIDNGSELFGNFSALKDGSKAEDGFEALLQYDSNYDGKIDNNDEIYQELKVWKDTNSDGITDEGELHSLQSQEVKAINNIFYKNYRKSA